MEGHDEKKQPIVVNGGAIIHCTAKIEAQLAEARQELARAEKHTKRHWSNAWRKAKLRKAGSHYGQAARLFYQTGDTDAAKAALLKAYDCYKSKRSWYWAAKTLEQAIRIAQERQDLDGLAEVAWKAAAVYDKAGQPDSAAYLLERVAKSLEDQQPIICSLMLEKAAETVETENRPILAAYYVNKLLLMSLARSDLSDATLKSRKLVALYQEAGHKPSTGRSVLGLVLLLVGLHRLEEAEKVAREFGNYCSLEQNLAIEQLLAGCEHGDPHMVGNALGNNCMNSLDEFKPVIDTLSKAYNVPSVVVGSSEEVKEELKRKDEKAAEGSQVEEATVPMIQDDEQQKSGQLVLHNDNDANRDDNSAVGNIKGDEMTTTTTTTTSSMEPLKNQQAEIAAVLPRRTSRLQKRATLATITPGMGSADATRFLTHSRACIDIATDSLDQHLAINLNPASSAAAYVDVTGVDPLQPKFMGMTTDQWREYKRSQSTHDFNEDD